MYTHARTHTHLLIVFVDTGFIFYICSSRGFKDLELDTPSIEKRFAYSFLQQLIRYVDGAHQYILEFGGCPSPAVASTVVGPVFTASGCSSMTLRPSLVCSLTA